MPLRIEKSPSVNEGITCVKLCHVGKTLKMESSLSNVDIISALLDPNLP